MPHEPSKPSTIVAQANLLRRAITPRDPDVDDVGDVEAIVPLKRTFAAGRSLPVAVNVRA